MTRHKTPWFVLSTCNDNVIRDPWDGPRYYPICPRTIAGFKRPSASQRAKPFAAVPFRGFEADCWLLPVHGAPMRAKDTLLAQLSKYAAFNRIDDITGYFRSNPLNRVREMRGELRDRSNDTTVSIIQLGISGVKRLSVLKGKLLGVEIEFYPDRQSARLCDRAMNNSSLIDFGTDGSLGDNGRELRKITWPNKDNRLAGIISLPLSGQADNSCGLHVHVDVRNYDQYQQETLYNRLLALEPHVKRLIPEHRRKSDWCAWGSNWGSDCRYFAWNARAIREHGTIEWRMQAGSINKLLIENWALFCQFWTHRCARASVPAKWSHFLSVMPEPLRSWCALRRDALYPRHEYIPLINERTSAVI